jgi:hypothetical protein
MIAPARGLRNTHGNALLSFGIDDFAAAFLNARIVLEESVEGFSRSGLCAPSLPPWQRPS